MVLGEDHHAGSAEATPSGSRSSSRTSTSTGRRTVVHRCGAQDYSPGHGVPYIGRVVPGSQRLHVAAGDKKCGLNSGTLADMLTADAIAGRDNPWASPSAQRA